MKTITMKKLLAIILALLMLFGGAVPSALAEEFDSLYTENSEGGMQPEDELTDIVAFGVQPATLMEVWEAITAYENEYNAVLDEFGPEEALKVQKPHWEFEVPEEIMPDGYRCELVDDDEDFGAEYYTFFEDEHEDNDDAKDDEDDDGNDEGDGIQEIVYDAQPQTMEEVQAAIDAYESEYLAVLEAEGFIAALEVWKPHWQYEAPEELMPYGYHCELVDWDEDFSAEYYTFFPAVAATAAGSNYVVNPPAGTDITEMFDFVGNTTVDSDYPNVAVISFDQLTQFGAMWAKEKLDLNLPFKTDMYLHLGHEQGKTGLVADGMTFTMHNNDDAITKMVGSAGQGLGVYQGLSSTSPPRPVGELLNNSLVIEFDTFTNGGTYSNIKDPTGPSGQAAHCSLIIPNLIRNPPTIDAEEHRAHTETFFFTPQQDWVKFEVIWEPSDLSGTLGGTLTYTFAGTTESYTMSDVRTVFGGTEVYWGFTGSTGGYSALQSAAITKLPTQEFIAEKTVKNAGGFNIDGEEAYVGETLTYSITVTAEKTIAGVGSVVIKDELSQYIELVGEKVKLIASDGTSLELTPSFEGNIMTIETNHSLENAGESLTVTFDVIALEGGLNKIVQNSATADATGLIEPQVSNTTEVKITSSSRKLVDKNSEAGFGGAVVGMGDVITYRIEYVNPTDEPANLTITDNLDDGLEFVKATDKNGATLNGFGAESRRIVWEISEVGAGEGGYVTLTAKVTGNAGAVIRNTAQMEWDGDEGGYDIENPDVVNPVGSYKVVDEASAAGAGGDAVTVNDVITYRIVYINPTGEAADLVITDELPKGLEFKSATDENDFPIGNYDLEKRIFECSIDDVPEGGSGYVILKAVVTVEAGAFITNKANMKWDTDDGEEPEIEEPEVTNPVYPYKIIDGESLAGLDGAALTVGDEITFRIGYINPTDSAATLIITDKLDDGLTYKESSIGGEYSDADHTVTWDMGSIALHGTGFVTLTVTVNSKVAGVVRNVASLLWDNGAPTEEKPEIELPVGSFKIVDELSESGKGGEYVTLDDLITYRIGYINPTGDVANLVITDELPKGLEFLSATDEEHNQLTGFSSQDRKIEWRIEGVPAGDGGYVTLTAKVTQEAGAFITNKADLEWDTDGGEPKAEEPLVTNPVFPYKIVDSESLAGLDGASVTVGDVITFRIGYVNPTGDYAKLTITDVLEEGLTYVSSSEGSAFDDDRTVTWDLGTVSPDGTTFVTLTVSINDSVGSIVTNTANVIWEPTVTGEPIDQHPVIELPVKSYKIVDEESEAGVGGAAVTLDDEIIYRIGYINPTGEYADLIIIDELPAGLKYVSSDGDYSGADNKVVWTIDNVPAGGSGSVTLTAKVTAEAGAYIVNKADMKWNNDGELLMGEEPEAKNPVYPYKIVAEDSGAGLDGAAVKVGDEITFRIGYVNPTGEEASLTITDILLTGLDFVECSVGGIHHPGTNTVIWDIGKLGSDDTGYVTLTVRVNENVGSTIKNTAALSWITTEGGVETEGNPEIVIPVISFKTVDSGSPAGTGGGPITVGGIITYRIGYVNPTGEAASLTIEDVLGDDLEFISAKDELGADVENYDEYTRKVTWNIESVEENGFGYVTVTVRVTRNAGAAIVNKASLKWNANEGGTEVEYPEVTIPVESYKMVDTDSKAGANGAAVKPGDEITYRIGYVNPTGEAAKLIITDELDIGLSYADCSDDGDYDEVARTVSWTIDPVTAGDAGFVTLIVRINENAEATITNKADLEWTVPGTGITHEDPEVINPVLSFKMVVSETGKDGAVVKSGDVITYRIGYVNPTDNPADLTITDNLNIGLKFVSATDENGGTYLGYNAQTHSIIWNIDDVEARGSGYVTLTVEVLEVTGTLIKNIAQMDWNVEGGNPVEENPEAVNPTGSFKIVDSDSESGIGGEAVRPGDEITYKIGYVNPTGEDAELIITDALEGGLTYETCTGGGEYDDVTRTVTWEIGKVPAGETGSVTLTVTVNENAEAVIRNSAEMSWDVEGWEVPGIEEPEVENPVLSFKIVDSSSTAGESGAAVKPGGEITYRIGYVNPTGEAAKLIITDELDIGLSYADCSDDGDYDEVARTVSWTIDPVGAKSAGFVTLTVTVNENAGAIIKNTAEMEWDIGNGEQPKTEEPDVENPVVSYKVVDGSSESGRDEDPVTVGNEITYRIGYVNLTDGPSELIITDKLEPSLTYVTCEGGGNYNAGSHTVTWEISEVAAKGTGYVTLTVRVNENAGAAIKNTAHIEWMSGGEPTEEEPGIEIPVGSFKTVDGGSLAGVNGEAVKPGDKITYKLGYVNPTDEVSSLTITDTLDGGLTYASSTGGGIYDDATRTVTWTIGEVPVGGAGSVTLTVTVREDAGAVIKNSAKMAWDNGGDLPDIEQPDVEIPVSSFKIVDSSSAAGLGGVQVNIGDEITYRIGYINPTGKPAKLTVKDTLEAGLTYVSSTGGGVYDSASRTVTWTINEMADDGAGYVTLTVKVSANAGVIVRNIAQMLWDNGDGASETEKPETENPVKPADRLYTVTYRANGGVGDHIVRSLPYGTRHTVLTRTATGIYRNNYRFTGWNTQPNGRGISYEPGDIIVVTSDVILYAQWERTTTPTKPSTDKPSSKPSLSKDSTDSTSKLDKDNHFAYIIGYPDGTVGPEKNITRAEAATIFFRLLTEETREKMWSTTNSYTDVSPDAWHNNAISTLTSAGILTGYSDGSFAPNRAITRAEFASIAVRFVEMSYTSGTSASFSDIKGHWAQRDIELAESLGYIEGYVDGTYRPDKPISRAEVATLLNRVLDRHVEESADLLVGMVTWPDNSLANWHYYDIQEATNSHYYSRKGDGFSEKWSQLRSVPDWSLLERPGAKPWDVKY